MADDLTLPATGGVVATDEVSSRHYQLIKPAFGADGSATLVATDAGMPIQSGYKEFSGSAATNSTDLVSQDMAGYRWVAVQITGTFTATVTFQGSNDNTNWVNVYLRSVTDTGNAASPFAAAAGIYVGGLNTRYFRARTTAYTSGTANAVVGAWANPTLPQIASVYVTGSPSVVQSGTWTVQPGNTPNTTAWLTQPVTGTSGGWSVSSTTSLTNTKVAVKASAGQLGGYMIYNPNTVETYIQVWNVASGSVTVGSTAPTYVLTIPASSAANLELTCGVAHSTAITIAATTTATGSTAPTTALCAAIFFK